MASYDALKPLNKEKLALQEGLFLHFITATQAGFVAAFVANPFDVVKSRHRRTQCGPAIAPYLTPFHVSRQGHEFLDRKVQRHGGLLWEDSR